MAPFSCHHVTKLMETSVYDPEASSITEDDKENSGGSQNAPSFQHGQSFVSCRTNWVYIRKQASYLRLLSRISDLLPLFLRFFLYNQISGTESGISPQILFGSKVLNQFTFGVCKEKMSASSSRKVVKVSQLAQHKVCKPRWLQPFLKKKFFGSCATHQNPKNELNKYCTTCIRSACQYCMDSGTHRYHKVLKIYKHVCKDAVALAAMEKYIDCSLIQTYKCDKQLVIDVSPVPHSHSAPNNDETLCETCGRKLAEPDLYRYCSISCKVKAFLKKPNDSVPPYITIQKPPKGKKEEKKEETKEETPKASKPSKRRKGTPRRAPLL